MGEGSIVDNDDIDMINTRNYLRPAMNSHIFLISMNKMPEIMFAR